MVIPRDSFSAGDRFYPGDSSLGIWSLSPSDRQDPVWFARKWTRNGRKWLRKSLPRPAFVPRSLRFNCSLTSVLISWCAAGGNFRVDDVKHFENFIDAAIEFEISNLKMCTVIPRCYAQRRSFRYECIILSLSLSLFHETYWNFIDAVIKNDYIELNVEFLINLKTCMRSYKAENW